MTLSLSTNQLKSVMNNAAGMTPEERSRFLEALAWCLRGNGYPTDAELASAVARALETVAPQTQRQSLDEINIAVYSKR